MDSWKKQKADAIVKYLSNPKLEVSSADINRKFQSISTSTIRQMLVELQNSGRIRAVIKKSGITKSLDNRSFPIYQSDIYWKSIDLEGASHSKEH